MTTAVLSTATSGARRRRAAANHRSVESRVGDACRAMVMDEFVVAHTLGWWAKSLILRHSGMCVPAARLLATAWRARMVAC